MKEKKTVLILLCLLLLPYVASAKTGLALDEIREQVQNGWHKTYTAYDRDIKIDVSPILPEMSHLPVYQLVYSRPQPSVSESESQLQYLLDDLPEEYQQIFGFGKNFPADSFAKERKAGDAKTIITNYVVDNIQLDQPYAEGNSLTIADVNRHVTTAMEQLGFSAKDFLLIRPHTVVAEVIVDPKTGLALAPGYLGVFYYQQLDGVPILCHAATAFARPDMPQFSAELYCQIANKDAYYISLSPLAVKECLAEDIPLCDFESVIQALERVVLDGHIRKVFSMELGYVLYTDPNYLGRGENITVEYYYAVPTWVVQCIYVTKPTDEYVVEDPMTERYCMEAATLLVNAQTGELQEYLGNPTDQRAFYRGFTPWDEIGATR